MLGAAAAGVARTVWVILTAAADGTTYHLFPLLIDTATPLAARYVVPRPLADIEAVPAAAFGAVPGRAGWLLLVVIDRCPSATFLEDQPGGVEGETIVLGLAGRRRGRDDRPRAGRRADRARLRRLPPLSAAAGPPAPRPRPEARARARARARAPTLGPRSMMRP